MGKEAKKEEKGVGVERLTDSNGQKEKEEEVVDKDDFRYAGKSKGEEMTLDDQPKDDAELTNEVEADDLSFLGEEYGDEKDDKQGVAEKEDQSEGSAEAEWDDTILEKDAQEIKEAQKRERKEKVEGVDSTVRTEKEAKLGEQEDKRSAKLAKQMIEETNKVLMSNPYLKGTQKKERKAKEGRGSVVVEDEESSEEGKSTPVKNNKTKVNPLRGQGQALKEDKVEVDSGEESVATIQQSNIKSSEARMSPSHDLRRAMDGIQLPVFRGTLPRKFLYRYDLKLQVPASEDPVAALIQAAKAFWAQMIDTDKMVALAPWAEE